MGTDDDGLPLLCSYAWSSLPSIEVGITLILEARRSEHLPEHPLARAYFRVMSSMTSDDLG